MPFALVLDTNVLSELMRPRPEARVLAWFDARQDADFSMTAITRAEILLGIALLPSGRRKDALAIAASGMFLEDFGGCCLPFDERAADALVVSERNRLGQPITTADAQIASIALVCGLTLVTRNVKDFSNIARLTLINPWDES